jgi:multidrug efflux system outer membrane protein
MNNSPVWFKRVFAVTFTVVLLAFAAGCTVGPKYKRPAVPTPPAFRGADDAAVISDAQGSLGDEQWAQVFREPELQDLIRKALTNNYDLRIAAQRILEQQAQVQITRSQQFPTLSVGGTGLGADIPRSTKSLDPIRSAARSLLDRLASPLHGTLTSGGSIASRRKPPAPPSWPKPGPSARCA